MTAHFARCKHCKRVWIYSTDKSLEDTMICSECNKRNIIKDMIITEKEFQDAGR